MGLRKILDNVEHHFQEGGKLERWYALYEVFDTFLYSPSSVTHTTAHVRDGVDLKRIMQEFWSNEALRRCSCGAIVKQPGEAQPPA